jgi:hypothetical protein
MLILDTALFSHSGDYVGFDSHDDYWRDRS